MSHRYILADVFTDRRFGGNPLAVFPDAAEIPGELMQLIATELNLSETCFLARTRADRWDLRIFTPRVELPFAGHPTVGSACVLAAIEAIDPGTDGASIILDEKAGPITAVVRRSGRRLSARFAVPRLPEFGPEPPSTDILASVISLSTPDIADDILVPKTASAGVPFLLIPVRDRMALARARLNGVAWTRELASFWAPHLYVITRDTELPRSTIRARMFAPAMGITEDPATGAAAAATARFLAFFHKYPEGQHHWRIEQGMEMGRPSLIDVFARITGEDLSAVHVGGSTVIVGEGTIHP